MYPTPVIVTETPGVSAPLSGGVVNTTPVVVVSCALVLKVYISGARMFMVGVRVPALPVGVDIIVPVEVDIGSISAR